MKPPEEEFQKRTFLVTITASTCKNFSLPLLLTPHYTRVTCLLSRVQCTVSLLESKCRPLCLRHWPGSRHTPVSALRSPLLTSSSVRGVLDPGAQGALIPHDKILISHGPFVTKIGLVHDLMHIASTIVWLSSHRESVLEPSSDQLSCFPNVA